MSECLTRETLEQYRDATFTNSEAYFAVDRHLSECSVCRDLLQQIVHPATDALVAAIGAVSVSNCLDDTQIADYVDGSADTLDREVVEEHTAHCGFCREDLASLREFHNAMQGFPWKRLEDAEDQHRTGATFGRSDFRRRVESAIDAVYRSWSGWPLSARMLIALALGIATGRFAGHHADILQSISEGILNLLAAVALPLIFIGVIHALMHSDLDGRTARRLVHLLVTNTLFAVAMGVLVMVLGHPGSVSLLPRRGIPESAPFRMPASILEPLVNDNVLFVILFAVALGMAMRSVRAEQIHAGKRDYEALESVMETVFRCLLRVLEWVIGVAPVAVFCSAASLTQRGGSKSLESIGGFVVAVLVALAVQAVYYIVRVRADSRITVRLFLTGARSAVLAAFSTASSAATMPITYNRVRTVLGIGERATSLGVLIGGSVNRDGTAMFEAMGVLFIIQMVGIHLGFGQIVVLIVMAALASICAPGVPEAGLITMTLVLRALGLAQLSPLIVYLLPFDWFLDRCRTAVNVMGHITVACVLEGQDENGSPVIDGAGLDARV